MTSEEKAAFLIARSLQTTITPIKKQDLNDGFFQRFGVQSELQPEFVKTYERLLDDVAALPGKYSAEIPVFYFLLNRYLTHSEDSGGKSNDIRLMALPGNPVFMAFAMLSENVVDVRKIGNGGYIATLAKSFKVSPSHIYEGIWIYLKNDSRLILEAVALMIKTNLNDSRCNDPDFFFYNILLPYFTYLVNGYALFPPIENSLFKQFGNAFKADGAEEALRTFSVGFKKFLIGDRISVKLKNRLNSVLAQYNVRVYMGERACVGYRVLGKRIRIDKNGVKNVLFIEKASISLSVPYLGLATSKEDDVVISYDELLDEVEIVQNDLKNGLPLFSCSAMPGDAWSALNPGISTQQADAILMTLLSREFSNQSKLRIVQRAIKKIAVHETKHKWDEQNESTKQWYNVDCETSASLTDALYGGTPLYSLMTLISQYQRFYASIQRPDVRATLKRHLNEFWSVAKAAADDSLACPHACPQVIDRLRRIYEGYTMVGGGGLPDLSIYKTGILPALEAALDKDPIVRDEVEKPSK